MRRERTDRGDSRFNRAAQGSTMRVHLTKYDVISLRKQALESEEVGDDGELFAEEALGCFNEEELESMEEALDGASAEDFFIDVFAAWEGEDPDALIDVLMRMLGEFDIELTFDPPDDDEDEEEDDFDGDADWDDASESDAEHDAQRY